MEQPDVQACFSRGTFINNEIFSAIRDINETLSLTNEPGQLVNMALDTLSQVLEIDGCWIQTVDGARHHRLSAQRGLSTEIQQELVSMNLDQGIAEEIIGLGHRVVIPDLSADGAYGLASFRRAGFKWLVAVPLMTYRVHGILGITSRNKKALRKETPELTMVIGGLIGAALNKSRLFQKSLKKDKPAQPHQEESAAPLQEPEGAPEPANTGGSNAAPSHEPERVPGPVETGESAAAPPQEPKDVPEPVDTGESTAAPPRESEDVPWPVDTGEPAPAPSPEKPASRRGERPFDLHKRRMKRFRGSHEPGQ